MSGLCLKGQMSDFQCFPGLWKPRRTERVKQLSDLHGNYGAGIHHKQTAREFKIRLVHWGYLFRKPVCCRVMICPASCDFWVRNKELKDVFTIFPSWDFSLSWDALHRCPCLLWAPLINKTRLSLTVLVLAFKAVGRIACKSGAALYICQRRNAQGHAVMNE